MTNTLVLGGARSGKSRYALQLAEKGVKDLVFIATAEALDSEMERRIARHQDERGDHWTTVEEPLELPRTIEEHTEQGTTCVVDCLTLWLSNLLHHKRELDDATEKLCTALREAKGDTILVSNEVGMGLVPETPLGRAFRDAQGRLNQQMAETCDRVIFVAAGLPLTLKG